MSDNGEAVINLMTGHEDADKVTVAFLVATAALSAGKRVTMFLTKEAVRLAFRGYADAIESAGAPPVARLFEKYREGGGELLYARSASRRAGSPRTTSWSPHASAGPTPLWEWIGDGATVFSY